MAECVPAVCTDCSESDLDVLVKEFDQWQKGTVELHRENKSLLLQLKGLEKKCEVYSQSEKHLMNDNSRLSDIVRELHNILDKRCDHEDENCQLKEQVDLLCKEINELETRHEHHMGEAMANITALRESHQKEIQQARETITQQMRKEVQSLQDAIVAKEVEIKQLQKALSDLERDKHTEVVKLRLEYDAKLLKLQKQNMKVQSVSQSSSVSSDIYRQKLRAVRVEYDKETTTLKRKVAELEKQLSSCSNKRRKF